MCIRDSGDADVGVRVGVFARVVIGWSVHMRVVLNFLGMREWPRLPHSPRGTCAVSYTHLAVQPVSDVLRRAVELLVSSEPSFI